MSSFKYFTLNSLFQCSGEETFVSQSQQVALSSTVLDKSTRSSGSRSRRRSSRRSNINKDDLLSFILSRSPEASSKSPKPINKEATDASESESDDDESWRHQQSVHGSVQKYLSKPPDPGQSVLISGNVKSRTRAHLSAPKAQVRTNLIGLHDTILKSKL